MKVTNFGTSKKLKELGIDEFSNINWVVGEALHNKEEIHYTKPTLIMGNNLLIDSGCIWAAYTLEDLLNMFPLNAPKIDFHLSSTGIIYNNNGTLRSEIKKDDESLIETTARLFINLVKDGVFHTNGLR